MSVDTLTPLRHGLQHRFADAHRPRIDNRGVRWPAEPAARLAVQLALAVPFVLTAMVVVSSGRVLTQTPNATLAARTATLPWDRADPTWVGHLYPPITTMIAAIVPGGELGLAVAGALAAGFLLHAVIEKMRQRGYAVTSTVAFALALAANPLFAFAATQNLEAFLGIGLFGLGFADLARFTLHRDTQSGFRAGILLMLSALCDPGGIVYVVVATLAAPLLSTRSRFGRGLANTLVVLFPTLCAFGGVFVLDWVFAGDPGGVFAGLISIAPDRLDILQVVFTTPAGWLWLATMAGTWVIGLLTGRPGAVIITALLFAAVVGGYVVGLIPESAAGAAYLLLMLTAMGFVPAAAGTRLTLLVNAFAAVELVIAWVTTFTDPITLEWFQALLAGLGR